MDPHPLRRLRRTPRAARILEVPDQFLLFRVDRNRGLLLPLGRPHAPRNIPKLRVSVDVLAAFACLRVALQAVAQAMQQFGDHGVADVMAQPLERHRQRARAQARPAQRRVRIAGRRRLDQRVQVTQQRGIEVGGPLAAATGFPRPRRVRPARCRRSRSPGLPSPPTRGAIAPSTRAREPRAWLAAWPDPQRHRTTCGSAVQAIIS